MQPVHSDTENIIELLNMILHFTKSREQVLIDNIRFLEKPGFVPKDLDAEAFSQIVDAALTEYMTHNRLVLRDTKDIRFLQNGAFHVTPAEDDDAVRLRPNTERYLQYQAQKLAQNATNARVAQRLIEMGVSDRPWVSGQRVPRDVA
jgi:flagellar basal body rod protein FlgB